MHPPESSLTRIFSWLFRILKWGGLALFVVNTLAATVFIMIGPPPADSGVAMPPVANYVGIALFGALVAAIGWIMDKKSRLDQG